MSVIEKFSNRAAYTFIVIGVLILVGAVVYAVDTSKPWHSLDQIELPSCNDGQILKLSGSAWQCADVGSGGGIQTETDPTVQANVKDGVSWSEITGVPPATIVTTDKISVPGVGYLSNQEIRGCRAVCAGYTYTAGIKNDNGVLKLKYTPPSFLGSSTGWIRGYSISGGKAFLEPDLGLLHVYSNTGAYDQGVCDLLTKSVKTCKYGSPGCTCSYISSDF